MQGVDYKIEIAILSFPYEKHLNSISADRVINGEMQSVVRTLTKVTLLNSVLPKL